MGNPDFTSASKSSNPRLDARWWWIGAALITMLVGWFFKVNPYFCEVVYSRGIFLLLRAVWDYTLAWLPIPLLYMAILGLLIWAGWEIRKVARRGFRYKGRFLIGRIALNLLAFTSAVYTLFYLSWGYNYHRRSVEDQLHIPEVQADSLGLVSEFERATEELVAANLILGRNDSIPLSFSELPDDLESQVRQLLTDTLEGLLYPTPGRVRAWRIQPSGFLMQLGASGIYIPFVGEGHYDAALPACLWPEVMAHEMAHGYGFGDEGTCNFWSWLACSGSADPAIRYSAYLSYWIEVARNYRKYFPEEYKDRRQQLPVSIRADLAAINAAYRKYPGFFPETYNRVYDSYLKQQGVKGGIKSYSRVIELRMGWEQLEEP